MPYRLLSHKEKLSENKHDISGTYLNDPTRIYSSEEIQQIERIRIVRENLSNDLMQNLLPKEILEVA